jgi:large subunit ribosomal protein L3
VQNLEVVDIRPENNLMLVRGAVPGAKQGIVVVRRAVKG